MRRILITNKEKEFASKYLSDMKAEGKGNYQTPLTRLNEFYNHLLKQGEKMERYSDYVNNIIRHYDEIITLLPSKFGEYQDEYFNGLDENNMSVGIDYKACTKPFFEWVLYCMRYDETRAKKLIQYIHKMGIRTCVYCNAQYAITFVSDEESFATYDLDHVWAKSSYPFLCTSFFNLVPSCPYCNKLKSKNPSDFNLYTEDEKEIDPFEFRLTRASKLKYYLSNQDDDLEISMVASDKGDQTNAANHNSLFHIDQIYSSHKDVVAEIIWKSRIYNESYRLQLRESFAKIFSGTNITFDFERMYKGYYTRPSDIHKRPLTKMLQDIGKQLGM